MGLFGGIAGDPEGARAFAAKLAPRLAPYSHQVLHVSGLGLSCSPHSSSAGKKVLQTVHNERRGVGKIRTVTGGKAVEKRAQGCKATSEASDRKERRPTAW